MAADDHRRARERVDEPRPVEALTLVPELVPDLDFEASRRRERHDRVDAACRRAREDALDPVRLEQRDEGARLLGTAFVERLGRKAL